MNVANIMKQFFRDRLGDAYRVEAYRNAVKDYAPPSEIMRVIKSTDDIIQEMIEDKTIRAVVRTSQSDYIGLTGIDGTSFTWSLEFAAPIDFDVESDIERIRKEFTEKIIPVTYNGNYEMLLAFTVPAQFAAQTINGVNYRQLVWGGRGTVTENSILANGFSFYIDGERIPGVVSFSNGFTPQGENYTTERSTHQRTALQTFTNAVGLSIHASVNNDVVRRIISSAASGDMDGFAFEVKQGDESVTQWDVAVFNQTGVAASLGSYVMIDVQILRS